MPEPDTGLCLRCNDAWVLLCGDDRRKRLRAFLGSTLAFDGTAKVSEQ